MAADNTEEHLRELVELARLYDVYGSLLNDHKKEIFESYVLDNYSLAEIAEQVGISRQGVRDIVRRCSAELMELERKLGFLKKTDRISELLSEVQELLGLEKLAEEKSELPADCDGKIKKASERLQEIADML